MHTLLLAADATLAEELAAAWRAGAAGTVDAATLPVTGPAAGVGPGVFVPLGALGLSAAAGSPTPAEARLRTLLDDADLVVLHLDVLDGTGLHEGPLPFVARVAGERALPVVVVAGRAEVSRREWSAGGVSGVHEVGAGSQARAAALGRVASTWAPRWEQPSPAV